MTRFLPERSPARWHETDGRPYGLAESLAWRALWSTWQLQVTVRQALGDKEARMPYDDMPVHPWTRGTSTNSQGLGEVADDRREEALDYLLNLE